MKLFKEIVYSLIIASVMFILFPHVDVYAAYDYANDKTALVFPQYANQDISNDFNKSQKVETTANVDADPLVLARYHGENSDQGTMHGSFYPIEITEYKMTHSIGYGDPQAVKIKMALGVPVNVRLTWGMVAAYEKATNTIYVSEETAQAYHTLELSDYMAVVDDDAAFKALQHKGRLETIAMVKDLVAKRNNKPNGATSDAVEALKNASVNNNEFNAYTYYSGNADLQTAIGADAQKLYEHWTTFGKSEGRKAK